ncbi:MAG TPA: glycerol kinase [Eubacterium sp.]|jgi:glycerol kinase|nr:glycerol kinase [Eubacterium sp.]HAX60921.1 glycerol kinase [Eubacterium sp.]HAZ85332.1 glycerol kinase [Eubacterium sp.]
MQRKKYVMALDQGTTSSRCILFDRQGNVVSMAQKEFTQIYPKTGWVEHDAMEIWSSQYGVAAEAMAKIGADAGDIDAIGITNQRETTIVWDRNTGVPVYNAICWQCHRTADRIDELKAQGYDKLIKSKTGLVPDAYFSATKIGWILDNVEGARKKAEAGELLFGTVDTWLIWKLSKGRIFVTDYTNASRTMLFNIHTRSWDDELLELFGVPRSMLAQVRPSSCIYGTTDEGLLGGEIKLAGAAGDQQAALFGQCCYGEGDVKNTYGTGCFLLMNTGKRAFESENGLITTIAADTDEEPSYALEGSVFVAGAAIQWLRDEMRMIDSSAQSEEYAKAVPDTNGVYVVPAFTGLGAPYWNQYCRGMVVGITRGCSKEHFVRATLESLAYQTHSVLKSMEQDTGLAISSLRVDGGASANDFLMQFQADILGADVLRPECIETTALGAAYLAGLATGYWQSREEIEKNWQLSHRFVPSMSDAIRQERLKGWDKAVRCALMWQD